MDQDIVNHHQQGLIAEVRMVVAHGDAWDGIEQRFEGVVLVFGHLAVVEACVGISSDGVQLFARAAHYVDFVEQNLPLAVVVLHSGDEIVVECLAFDFGCVGFEVVNILGEKFGKQLYFTHILASLVV